MEMKNVRDIRLPRQAEACLAMTWLILPTVNCLLSTFSESIRERNRIDRRHLRDDPGFCGGGSCCGSFVFGVEIGYPTADEISEAGAEKAVGDPMESLIRSGERSKKCRNVGKDLQPERFCIKG